MKLYLIRHAEAGYSRPDSKRALTDHGVATAVQLARSLPVKLGKTIATIEHSPYVRARQTAELIRQHGLPSASLLAIPDITPEDSPDRIGPTLWQSGRDRMLVGHNPHLEILVHQLLGLRRSLFSFSKSALVVLKLCGEPTLELPWGCWELKGLLKPKDIRGD
jgi:phosphohistidine phosphatase